MSAASDDESSSSENEQESPSTPQSSVLLDSIRYSSWFRNLTWIETYTGIFVTLAVGIIMFGQIPSIHARYVALWYGPQLLGPMFSFAAALFIGPPVPGSTAFRLARDGIRFRFHAIVYLVFSILAIVMGLTFLGFQVAYLVSSECRADVTSVCHQVAPFVFVLIFACCMILLEALGIVALLYTWFGQDQKRE